MTYQLGRAFLNLDCTQNRLGQRRQQDGLSEHTAQRVEDRGVAQCHFSGDIALDDVHSTGTGIIADVDASQPDITDAVCSNRLQVAADRYNGAHSRRIRACIYNRVDLYQAMMNELVFRV